MHINLSQMQLQAQPPLSVAQWRLKHRIPGRAEDMLVVPMPCTLLQLVLHGSWHTISALGRWTIMLNEIPSAMQQKVGPVGTHSPDAEDGALSPAGLMDLVQKIQSWAPRLLQSATNDDERADLQMELEGSVR